jgi:beta-lactamase class A
MQGVNMGNSRRNFLGNAAATIGAMSITRSTFAEQKAASPDAIVSLFKGMPGEVALKIYSPAVKGKPAFLTESNASKMTFVGSAIKTFILCETMRQLDSPNIVQALKVKQLSLDASVWSLDSATFNPPNLIGKVSHRTALEAMIMHSDNTGTDMSIKEAGPDKVRAFIASAGLKNTLIPESTRSMVAYMLGAKEYKSFTWEDLGAAANASLVNSPMNKVQTMTSSPEDMVSYYSRSLQGEFFKNKETLGEFKRILSIGDVISILPFPAGISAFAKGGSIDVPGFHALCVPGGMQFDDRWVYFCFAINWDAKAVTDINTVNTFVAATSHALAMVKEALSS